MLTIGEFSRICFVTKKTLRHYDEIGLLRPEHITENGYRYYTVGQLRTMLLISRLKTYGFSLPEIAAVISNPDKGLLAEKLLEKRARMEAGLQNTRRILRQMEQDAEKLKRRVDIMDQNIVVKTVELSPVNAYCQRKKVTVQDFGEAISRFFADVEQKQLRPSGPLMVFYTDEEFNQDDIAIEIAIPVSGGGEGVRELPGGLHCFATILGPYKSENFSAAYAGTAAWIEENGYRISGAPFDKYVRGGDGVLPEEYVTEVYFPIEK